MISWRRLAWASCAISGLIVAIFAVVKGARGELDAMYCSTLPAGDFLSCMPSGTGIITAALLTIVGAIPIFALFSPLTLMGAKRIHKGTQAGD